MNIIVHIPFLTFFMLKSKEPNKAVWNNRPMLNVYPRSIAAVKGTSTTVVSVHAGHV